MRDVIQSIVFWNRGTKFDFTAIDVCTSVKIVVTHPLQEILHVAFVRLKNFLHDCSLAQEIGQASHVKRIEHVDLEEEFVANIIAIERHTLDKTDMGDKRSLAIVHVSAITHSKGMIDGEM